MKWSGFATVLLFITLCFVGSPRTTFAAVSLGPFDDGQKQVDTLHVPVTFKSFLGPTVNIPLIPGFANLGQFAFGLKDDMNFTLDIPIFVRILSYVKITFFPFGVESVEVEDVMGIGVSLDQLDLTGFSSVDPQLVPLGPEHFIGLSGTVYTASTTTSTLGDLPSNPIMQGFDLSMISGDPTSFVYISSAVLPLADSGFFVTEPSSLTLIAIGTLILIACNWYRHRQADASCICR